MNASRDRQKDPQATNRGLSQANPAERSSNGLLPVAVCIFLSGAGSLMLEVVWSRLLRLVFGSTTLAVSTILVAYMLGLGLGGLFGGRLAARLRNGVRAYGQMEVVIGIYAAFVPWILDLFPMLARAVLPELGFWPATLYRFVVVLLVLLLPTLCMGATLPVLVAALVRGRSTVARPVGLLYGLNTLGAVSGVFVSTFVLFPAIGVRLTNLAGAGVDLAVGLIAIFLLAPRFASAKAPEAASRQAADVGRRPERVATAPLARWNPALLSYGCVGFTALAYEVCWTRALAMILGSSIYAFATMLAAFLTGIALGSLIGRRWFDGLRRPLYAYAVGLGLLGLLSLATLVAFRALPETFTWFISNLGVSSLSLEGTSVIVAMLAMLGPTLVLGALFPLVTRALAAEGFDTSQTVGDVYFVNTLGSAAGAFAAGFVLIPLLGLRTTLAISMAVNFAAAAAVLLWQRQWTGPPRAIAAAVAAGLAATVLISPPDWNEVGLAQGAFRADRIEVPVNPVPLTGMPGEDLLFYREGINTTVSVHRNGAYLDIRSNGKPDASTSTDMSTQILIGQIPMLFGPRAERVLTIGLASGVSVGSAAVHEPKQLDVVELEPAMTPASHFFDDYNNRPLDRPYVHSIADDGRTFLAYTRQRYDVIISEPSNPWITGASNLFTREFFHTARMALAPGGRLCQWIQLYGMDPDGLRAMIAALHAEFPYVYGFLYQITGPDLILLATETPIERSQLPAWERLSEPVRNDLTRINNFSTTDLWSLLRILPSDIEAIAADSKVINTDDNMYVELRAPWTLYNYALMQENLKLLLRSSQGVLPVVMQGGEPVDADTIGQLALSYATLRNDVPVAREMVKEAQARGGSAYVLLAATPPALASKPDQVPAALGRLNRAVDMLPEAFTPRWYRAEFLQATQQSHAALEDVEAALRINPGDLRARLLRPQILFNLGRPEEAQKDIEPLLKTSYAQIHANMWPLAAMIAANLGQFDDAIRYLREALARNPDFSEGWSMLAVVSEKAGKPEEAQIATANAGRAAVNRTLVLHQSALRAERLGAKTTAIAYLKQALQVDPSYEAGRRDLLRLGGG